MLVGLVSWGKWGRFGIGRTLVMMTATTLLTTWMSYSCQFSLSYRQMLLGSGGCQNRSVGFDWDLLMIEIQASCLWFRGAKGRQLLNNDQA